MHRGKEEGKGESSDSKAFDLILEKPCNSDLPGFFVCVEFP